MSSPEPGRRPRILEVHWTFPPTTGGVESHLADLSRQLAARGCEVTVLTGEPQPIASDGCDVISTELLNLDRMKDRVHPDLNAAEKLEQQLAAIIRAKKIEVVHGHNLHHFARAPAQAIEQFRASGGLRVFHTFHETWPDLLRKEPVYRRWDGNFAVSGFVQRQCRLMLGFEPELLPLGVDTSIFRPFHRPQNAGSPPVVLHPARLLPWKGVEISVRMLRMLVDRGQQATLVITDTQRVADWNDELTRYRAFILALIEKLDLGDWIRLVRAAYADMPRLHAEADVVIYPTVGEEPYGLVPLEAMSCERPIVASRSGGIPETVVDGVTGFTVAPGDVSELADRVGLLLSSPELARRMGLAGRERVMQDFDADAYANTLLRRFCAAGAGSLKTPRNFAIRAQGC
jgi:glycosyltransferase involved in cell wall biosynthesis